MKTPEGFIYQIVDHGVDHLQYFPGLGVGHTLYTEAVTGVGPSAHAAGEDALEMFWQRMDKRKITVHEMERLEAEIGRLSIEEDAHNDCEDDGQQAHDDNCEMIHYVTIRWAVYPRRDR